MSGDSKTKRPFWLELTILIVVAATVAVTVRTFVVQTFYIPSESMRDTLRVDDKILVNKLIYRLRDPRRGEVIVFRPPSAWQSEAGKDEYIKRVIGVGGDHLVCCDARQRITVNGTALDEDYLFPGDRPGDIPFDVTVPAGRVFVLGDHRSASSDSHAHLKIDGGTVAVDRIAGPAFALFWPFSHARWLSPPDVFARIPEAGSAGAPR